MADHPVAPQPATGSSQPEAGASQSEAGSSEWAAGASATQARSEGRGLAWRTGLAVLALSAVVGGLVAGVRSAASEPSPPDLGGPILALGAAPSVTSPPPRIDPATPPAMLAQPEQLSRDLRLGAANPSPATEVQVRPVPLPVASTDIEIRRQTATPAPARATDVPGTVIPSQTP